MYMLILQSMATSQTRSLSAVETYSKLYYTSRASSRIVEEWVAEGNAFNSPPDISNIKRLLTIVYNNEDPEIKASVQQAMEEDKARRSSADDQLQEYTEVSLEYVPIYFTRLYILSDM